MGKSKSKKGGAGASASAGGGAGGGGGAQQQQQQQQNSKAAGPRCSVCRAEGSEIKYNCPVDRVGYCSVPCFKRHKAESCAALRQTVSTAVQPPSNSSYIPAKRKHAQGEGDDVDRVPKRALPDLMWPPDPLEEGLNALSDPLNRDEVKPLLHSELLAIATSVPLRQLLAKHPLLEDLLATLSRIPNAPPRYPQNTRVRNILGLGEAEGVPNKFYYRPGEEESAATGHDRPGAGAGARGGGGRPGMPHPVNLEERKALLEFGDLVKGVLREERSKRENLQQ